MAVLPTDYTDSVTPTGATTEYPATTTRGLNATHTQINTNTTALASAATLTGAEALTNKTIDGPSNTITNVAGTLQPVRLVAETGLTYTISAGSVTQIAGTTIDGVSVAIGDRIAVVGAPAATGAGVGNSDQAGNGIYVVTGNTTNTTLARAPDMAGSAVPWGVSFEVREGAGNTDYTFFWVNRAGAFTWGTTVSKYSGYTKFHTGFVDVLVDRDRAQTLTGKTIDGANNTLTIRAADIPSGITNGNTAAQSQITVANTSYYITGSNLNLPATLKTGMAVGTRFRWTVAVAKTAAGTGTFSIIIYRGTNGTTADTADVTQSIGTQTAAVDNMVVDVEMVVTTTGATGAYYWTIIPTNKAITATGFGVATGATGQFSGTVSSVAMNTASLKFGLGFRNGTPGTPTITVPMVRAQALNIS